MRRRLWWSLILFDTRICEMADWKTAMLVPTWDCRTPLNLNDFDLRPEMKDPPAVQEKSSEALFAVVRSEMGNFVRHTAFHLDFVNPALKAVAKDVEDGHIPGGDELVTLEKMIENNHLKFCNPENPLHFMTIWTARGYLAKNRLLEHYSRFPRSSVQQTDVQRNAALSHALIILQCDTNLMSSPLTKGYLWFVHSYFPFSAYIHIVQDLRMRPVSDKTEQCWEIMNDNYQAHFTSLAKEDNPLYKVFTKLILQAWGAREVVFRQSDQAGKPLVPPRIVSDIKQKVAKATPDAHDCFDMNTDFSMPMPYHNMPGQAALDFDFNNLEWTPMDWNSLYRCDW